MYYQNDSILSLLNPSEQFEIINYWSIINNYIFCLWINCLCLIVLFFLSIRIFWYIQILLLNSIKNIYKSMFSIKNQEFFIIFYFFFLLILVNNLIGLLPYAYTITSFLLTTFFFSFIFFFGIVYIGLEKYKMNFLSLFVPKNVPQYILQFLIIIEILSYFMRLVSLSVRLFANMVAGHILLKILLSFMWVSLVTMTIFSSFSLILWAIVVIVMILELLIACLQAYVFLFLNLVYLSEVC